MKIVLIQLLLIVVVVLIAVRLLRDRGARTQAVRRLGLLLFAAFAVWSILFPSVWNQIARLVGVGRGTDMVMYALVVAFLSFTLTTYVRFREFEARYTKLARRLALDEAGPPRSAPAAPEQAAEAGPEQQETPYAGS